MSWLSRQARQTVVGLGAVIVFALALSVSTTTAFAGGISVVSNLTCASDLEPGARIEGEVRLRNSGSEPGEVRLYQTDYVFQADGSNDFGDPGSNPRSNAGWIDLSQPQVLLQPGQTVAVKYSLAVPQDPGLSGTYWSIIMVEPLAAPTPEVDQGKPQVTLRTVLRYAIQVITNVGDTGKRDLRFADRQVVADGVSRVLQLDVANTGERLLTPTLWAELYDQGGASMGRFEARRQRLYPTCSGRYRIDLSKVPPGSYTALVVADNGDAYVFGARYALQLTALTAEAPVTQTATASATPAK